MADEHNAWLDRATADELLRGGTPGPVGSGADPRARAEAARMRAALDALAPRSAGGELPGEEAALAAFRAARAEAPAPAAPASAAAAAPAGPGVPGADREPVVDLAPIPPIRIPAQRRPVTAARFGLAAALASVAVGGIAAVAGTGLLDRAAHLTAGPAPAVSVSADSDPAPAGDTAGATLVPQLRPTPSLGVDGFSRGPDASPTPGTGMRTLPDVAPSLPVPPGTAGAGGGGGGAAGTDGTRDKNADGGGATADSGMNQGIEAEKPRPEDLCRANKAKKLTDDRREYLSKLAGGAAKVQRFCATLLDGATKGTVPRSGADQGSAPLPVPSMTPLTSGGLGFRIR
ncbi:hypothetical protein [Streptomyces lavendulae]|uniref:hypothetical protein n=1 Tax=Streptomyces lavendulae TaxID=1914 RepID=UPI0024A06C13|nr:hypothetical protein [Streptomyces lavendulae]GLX18005.1 hypothetical protein Slala01_16490 [Streptomyces lavendulae subsp. lavendulae]GLX26349.1 hypothetical protein Slala02_21690 [Streptomyces lavendulae subsp. lavendulae]